MCQIRQNTTKCGGWLIDWTDGRVRNSAGRKTEQNSAGQTDGRGTERDRTQLNSEYVINENICELRNRMPMNARFFIPYSEHLKKKIFFFF